MKLAVFLLAGRGSRINNYTNSIPKCLIHVNGKSLLHYMLDKMAARGVQKSILVTGYLGNKIEEAVGESWKGMQIEYVVNKEWESTNNIYSLSLANHAIDKNFLLIEGDIIISDEAFGLLDGSDNFMAVSHWEEHLDGTMVAMKEDEVSYMYLKQNINGVPDIKKLYKTVNIYGILNRDYNNLIVPEMKRLIESGETGAYYEQAFANLLNNKELSFRGIDLSSFKWAEIDNEDDLRRARKLFATS